MGRRIVGSLLDPGGGPMVGSLRFVAMGDVAPSLVEGSVSSEMLAGGAYDVTLEDGRYRVDLSSDDLFSEVGYITITAGADITLPELLGVE